MSGDMFVYYDLVGDGGQDGIWRVEAGGTAKHCTLHSAAVTTKNLSGHKMLIVPRALAYAHM